MKKLIFLFLGFFCFANSQSDSLLLIQRANKFDQKLQVTVQKLENLKKLDRENETLIYKIKVYIKKLTTKEKILARENIQNSTQNSQAVKVNNINEPVMEIIIPDGTDSIKGNFFYRLFHREIYILKPYKIVNDEKIYLD